MNPFKILFLLAILLSFSLSCSSDDSDPNAPLPEATRTGRGIFGCKVNGESFIDNTGTFFNTFYQQVDGEFFFGLQGSNTRLNPRSIGFGTNAKMISEGEILPLIENEIGNAWGTAFFRISNTQGESSRTSTSFRGTLEITKLDFDNNIVSGLFSFDIEHPETGERIEIREGRFDTLFTQ